MFLVRSVTARAHGMRSVRFFGEGPRKFGLRVPSPVDYLRKPMLASSTAELPLATFPRSIISYMPYIPDMRESQRDMLLVSLNQMLVNAFEGDNDKLNVTRELSIDGGLADLSDPLLLAQNTKLELVIDRGRMTSAGMVVHEVVQSDRQKAIFYHPKVWAIRSSVNSEKSERDYTGLGLIPLLMAKFAFCLQLSYPDRPCYMAIPVYSPWVLRMLKNRFGMPLTSFEKLSLSAQEQSLRDEAMYLLGLKTSYKNKEGYPCYELPKRVNTESFRSTHHSKNRDAILEEEAFCSNFLLPNDQLSIEATHKYYNQNKQQFCSHGFLAIVPCSVKVLKFFEESILASSADHTRIFGRHLPPDHLFLDPGEKSPFLTDVAKLYYFGQNHPSGIVPVDKLSPDIDTFEGVEQRLKNTTHLFNFCATKCKLSPHPSQEIKSFYGSPITLSNVLVPTEVKVIPREDFQLVTVHSEIHRVRDLAVTHRAFLLDQLDQLLKNSFRGGDFLKREEFRKRFDRPHTYIELFTQGGYVIGFLFHEPFKLILNTVEKPSDPLEIIVLKSGIGCFSENYQRHGLATFFIRRFLMRLQLDFPGTPVFHHFIASSSAILKSELDGVKVHHEQDSDFDLFLANFYPGPDPDNDLLERKLSPEERELIYAIFCAEVRLKYEAGGTAFAGMFAHAKNLPVGIPYPVVPRDHISNSAFINELFKRATSEMEYDAEKYGMKIMRNDDGNETSAGLLSPGIRVFSHLSSTRVAAYVDDRLYPHIEVPGSDADLKLIRALKPWCRSKEAKTTFNILSGQMFGDIEEAISRIIPRNQNQARDPSWPSLDVEGDMVNSVIPSLIRR